VAGRDEISVLTSGPGALGGRKIPGKYGPAKEKCYRYYDRASFLGRVAAEHANLIAEQ
jgi:hypothetical protein